MAGVTILMVPNDEIDNLCHGASPAIRLSYLVDCSLPGVATLHQFLNSQPNHLPPIVLLFDTMHPIAMLSAAPVFSRLPSSNSKLVLLPKLS
jgi:hypothetical protein